MSLSDKTLDPQLLISFITLAASPHQNVQRRKEWKWEFSAVAIDHTMLGLPDKRDFYITNTTKRSRFWIWTEAFPCLHRAQEHCSSSQHTSCLSSWVGVNIEGRESKVGAIFHQYWMLEHMGFPANMTCSTLFCRIMSQHCPCDMVNIRHVIPTSRQQSVRCHKTFR